MYRLPSSVVRRCISSDGVVLHPCRFASRKTRVSTIERKPVYFTQGMTYDIAPAGTSEQNIQNASNANSKISPSSGKKNKKKAGTTSFAEAIDDRLSRGLSPMADEPLASDTSSPFPQDMPSYHVRQSLLRASIDPEVGGGKRKKTRKRLGRLEQKEIDAIDRGETSEGASMLAKHVPGGLSMQTNYRAKTKRSLNERITACIFTTQVMDIFEHHFREFSRINIIAALYKISVLAHMEGNTDIVREDTRMSPMLDLMRYYIPQYDGRELTQVAAILHRFKFSEKHEHLTLWKSTANQMTKKVGAMNSKYVTSIIMPFALQGIYDGKMMSSVSIRLFRKATYIRPNDAATILWSFANLHYGVNSNTVQDVTRRIMATSPFLTSRSVAHAAWAMSVLGTATKGRLEVLTKSIERSPEKFNDMEQYDMVRMLWALATNGCNTPKIYRHVFSSMQPTNMRPTQLSEALWAAVTIPASNRDSLNDVISVFARDALRCAITRVYDFSHSEVSNVIWAIAHMPDHSHRPLLPLFSRRISLSLTSVAPDQLSTTLYALARADDVKSSTLFEMALPRLLHEMPHKGERSLAHVLWASVSLSGLNPNTRSEIVSAAIDCIRTRGLHTFDYASLIILKDACVELNDASLMNGVDEAISDLKEQIYCRSCEPDMEAQYQLRIRRMGSKLREMSKKRQSERDMKKIIKDDGDSNVDVKLETQESDDDEWVDPDDLYEDTSERNQLNEAAMKNELALSKREENRKKLNQYVLKHRSKNIRRKVGSTAIPFA